MTNYCRKCESEDRIRKVDKENTHAVLTIKRGANIKRYYLCEAHANELDFIWLDGK